MLGRPYEDGVGPELRLGELERLLNLPELSVGVYNLSVVPTGLAGDDEVVAILPLGFSDGLKVELQLVACDDLSALFVEGEVLHVLGCATADHLGAGTRVGYKLSGFLECFLSLAPRVPLILL
jgi:hypothetical protein